MSTSESTPKRGMWKEIIVLFLPKTSAARLTLLGFILLNVSILLYPTAGIAGPASPNAIDLSLTSIYIVLFVWAFIMAAWDSLKQKGHKAESLSRKLAIAVGALIAYSIVYEALTALARVVASMVAGGNIRFIVLINSGPTDNTIGYAESYLLIVTIVLLIWIPQVFFGIQLDISGTGDAQRVLLRLITGASCAMTGVVFILFHFGGGPLRNLNFGTLIIGIVGTVLLLAHPYRSLARVCWQRGIAGAFSLPALRQRWGNMVTELGKAIDRTTEHDGTPPSAAIPAVKK